MPDSNEEAEAPEDNKPYPIRLSGELRTAISIVASEIDLDFPDTMRQAIKFGLPEVRKRLKKTGR